MQVVATAGHVDHGKSALLRRLTGREPDRWAEERRRGLTIDLGYVWTDLEGPDGTSITVAFVDVPGHDSFLPNMLCGVGVVEQILFVVAADDGWSAQSQEHLEILDLLARRGVAAVVTKADLAGPHRTAEVVADVRRRLATTSLSEAPVLAVDSLGGTGFAALRATLAERLAPAPATPDAVGSPAREPAGADRARLWIDRVFTITGAGTVVTGMLTSGTLTVGQDVEVAPQGLSGRIRGMQCLEQPVTSAGAGMRVAVNLGGIAHGTLGRGDALLGRSGAPVGPRDRTPARRGPDRRAVDVWLRALPHTGIGRTGAWHLHLGTATTTVQVVPLLDDLEPGGQGPVRLELDRPLPVRAGDRFVLREAGRRRTAGGGRVLDPLPVTRRRGTEQRLAHALTLEELAVASAPADRIRALVDAHDGRRDHRELMEVVGSDAPDPDTIGGLERLADQIVRAERISPWTEHLVAAAAAAPPTEAVELSRLTAAAAAQGCPPELGPALVDRAVRLGQLHRHGGRVVHAANEPAYLTARDRRQGAFRAALAEAAFDPPDPALLAEAVGIPSFEVQELIDAGSVVAAGGLLLDPAVIGIALDRLRHGPGADAAAFTASEARQCWETSRRCAMPLLDHLRVTGRTSFDGTHHRLIDLGAA